MRVEFPYRVTELDELPEPFAVAAPPAVETIFVPPQGFGGWWNRRGEPALALGKKQVWILEERGESVTRREIPFDKLLEIEIGHVLLHAWVGFVPDGAEPVQIDFNAVSLPIFKELVDRICERLRGDAPGTTPVVPNFGVLDLKFRNAVRGELLQGEVPEALTFAPALWGRRFLVLRRRLVAATGLAPTDWRLLIVEEGEAVRENTYGSTAYSILRDRILDIAPSPEGVVVVCRSRSGGYQRRVRLSDPEAAKLYRVVVRQELQLLSQVSEPSKTSSALSSLLGRSSTGTSAITEPGVGCMVCRAEKGAEERYLRVLLEGAENGSLEGLLDGPGAACVRHLSRASTLAGGRLPGALLEVSQAALEDLEVDLDRFIRHKDHRFADEPWGKERDAWKRAVERTVGLREW